MKIVFIVSSVHILLHIARIKVPSFKSNQMFQILISLSWLSVFIINVRTAYYYMEDNIAIVIFHYDGNELCGSVCFCT